MAFFPCIYFESLSIYWFFGCEPTYGRSIQQTPKEKIKNVIGGKELGGSARGSDIAGICSEERSMISPDYARNFICDFILGKEQIHTERSLFD